MGGCSNPSPADSLTRAAPPPTPLGVVSSIAARQQTNAGPPFLSSARPIFDCAKHPSLMFAMGRKRTLEAAPLKAPIAKLDIAEPLPKYVSAALSEGINVFDW